MFVFILKGQNPFCRFLWRWVSQCWDSSCTAWVQHWTTTESCRCSWTYRHYNAGLYYGWGFWGKRLNQPISEWDEYTNGTWNCSAFVATVNILNPLQMGRFLELFLANCHMMLCKKISSKTQWSGNNQVITLRFSSCVDHLILPTAGEFLLVSKMWCSLKRDCKNMIGQHGLNFPWGMNQLWFIKGQGLIFIYVEAPVYSSGSQKKPQCKQEWGSQQ